MRLTITRAVNGFVGLASQSASCRRPLSFAGMMVFASGGNVTWSTPRGASSPRVLRLPRMQTLISPTFAASSTAIAVGRGGPASVSFFNSPASFFTSSASPGSLRCTAVVLPFARRMRSLRTATVVSYFLTARSCFAFIGSGFSTHFETLS